MFENRASHTSSTHLPPLQRDDVKFLSKSPRCNFSWKKDVSWLVQHESMRKKNGKAEPGQSLNRLDEETFSTYPNSMKSSLSLLPVPEEGTNALLSHSTHNPLTTSEKRPDWIPQPGRHRYTQHCDGSHELLALHAFSDIWLESTTTHKALWLTVFEQYLTGMNNFPYNKSRRRFGWRKRTRPSSKLQKTNQTPPSFPITWFFRVPLPSCPRYFCPLRYQKSLCI